MGKYSKLIGTLIGGVIGIGITLGFLPEEFAEKQSEIIAAVTLLTGLIGTFFAPKNAE